MRLISFLPDTPDFALYLTLAWRWMRDRPRFFPASGGFHTLREYLDEAAQPHKKHIGVFVDGAMVSMVSLELEPDRSCLVHVTSPRKSDPDLIAAATYQVGCSAFRQISSIDTLYTMSPCINGHWHKGSQHLALLCGMKPYGLPEQRQIGQTTYLWQRYDLTRRDWEQEHG